MSDEFELQLEKEELPLIWELVKMCDLYKQKDNQKVKKKRKKARK